MDRNSHMVMMPKKAGVLQEWRVEGKAGDQLKGDE